MKMTDEALQAGTIQELEIHLDTEADAEGRSYLKGVMAIRNAKVAQLQLDHWGLTADQYAAAKADGEGQLGQRLDRARQAVGQAVRGAQTVTAGVAVIGVTVEGVK